MWPWRRNSPHKVEVEVPNHQKELVGEGVTERVGQEEHIRQLGVEIARLRAQIAKLRVQIARLGALCAAKRDDVDPELVKAAATASNG